MADASFGEQLMWVLPFGCLGIVSWGFWLVGKVLAATARPVNRLLERLREALLRHGDEQVAASPALSVPESTRGLR